MAIAAAVQTDGRTERDWRDWTSGTSEKSDGTMVLYRRKADGFHDASMACR